MSKDFSMNVIPVDFSQVPGALSDLDMDIELAGLCSELPNSLDAWLLKDDEDSLAGVVYYESTKLPEMNMLTHFTLLSRSLDVSDERLVEIAGAGDNIDLVGLKVVMDSLERVIKKVKSETQVRR